YRSSMSRGSSCGTLSSAAGPFGLVTGIAIVAAGAGATFVAATTTALAHVAPDRAGVASGVVNTFHELGGAFGIAAVSSIAAGSLAPGAGGGGFVGALVFAAVTAIAAAALALVVVPGGRPPAGAVAHLH
ncbi:MFS transporter, partial [Dactylosporangium sp. NPDC005572]